MICEKGVEGALPLLGDAVPKPLLGFLMTDLGLLYQGRLQELQQDAQIGWEAAQRGELVDGSTAITQIRVNLHSRHTSES